MGEDTTEHDIQEERGPEAESPTENRQKEETDAAKIRVRRLLQSAIEKVDAVLNSKEYKPTLGDYLKLMQLEKEFEADEPKEIVVRWVGPMPQKESK